MIAVFFEADAFPHAKERYLQLAAELQPLLADVPGFIAIERFQSLSTAGKILSLSWRENEQAVTGWKQNLVHQAAQQIPLSVLVAIGSRCVIQSCCILPVNAFTLG